MTSIMKRVFPALVACAAISIHASVAIAASPAQLGQAQELLKAERPQQALALLEAAHEPGAASTQELFLLGIAAKQSNRLAKSESYFRTALAQEPNAGRIRLELAEVLYRRGKLDASHAELLTVRRMNPPEQVRRNIDGFISQVETARANPRAARKGPQKNWSAYITVGLTSDSNVNAGPDDDQVFLYGLPFTLSAAAQETSDIAFFTRLGAYHQHKVGDGVDWQSAVHLSFTDYVDADPYDSTSLHLRSGPSYRLNERIGLSIPVTYAMQYYQQMGDWYSQSWGIAPRLKYAARKNVQLYLDGSISRKVYNGNGDRDLSSYTISPSLNYQPSATSNIAVGLQYGKEESGLDIYSNQVQGIFVGYQHVFPKAGLRATLSASYTDTKFDGIQAGYTEARHDRATRVAAAVYYSVPSVKDLTLSGAINYHDNQSNQDLNDYDRTQITVSLTKRY